MTTLSLPDVLSPRVQEAVPTAVAGAESFAHEEYARRRPGCWQQIIDQTLAEWGRNPSALEDDGVRAPSADSIAAAIRIAETLRDNSLPPPISVVPSGDGGISFERGDRQSYEMIEVCPDGSAEHFTFVKSRLIRRQPFCL